jgi:hypothetical protein
VSEPDQDDEFTAGQRRRKLIGGIIAVVGVAAIATFVLVRRANKLPALDPDEVRDVREALDKIPPEYRRELAAAAFVQLEGERIPGALLESFEAFNNAPPDMVELVLLRSIADDPDVRSAWLLACPDGLNVLAEAGTSGAGGQHVYERCELSRFGLLGESELGGASMGALVITHAAWAHLVEHDSETDLERRLLRTMLGRG